MTRSRLALSFGEKLDLDLVVGDAPPPATGAVVVPQDVHLILGEVGPLEDTRETPEQVLAASGQDRPKKPGSIVVAPAREGAPLLVQAIVYDFDHTPPAREVHVFEALLAAFEEARTRGLRSLAVQPLGTAHAGLDPARFLGLLARCAIPRRRWAPLSAACTSSCPRPRSWSATRCCCRRWSSPA